MENKSLNIYQRILAVMSELDYIQKSEKTVNNQYRFVSHDQVAAAIHPQLVKQGIVIVPSTKSISQEEFAVMQKGERIIQQRTQVCLATRFVNVEYPQDAVEIETWGYALDSSDKGPGKAVSYAYKYALLKMFCLETGDDPDEVAQPASIKVATISREQKKQLEAMIGEDEALKTRILKQCDVAKLEEISSTRYSEVAGKLKFTLDQRSGSKNQMVAP